MTGRQTVGSGLSRSAPAGTRPDEIEQYRQVEAVLRPRLALSQISFCRGSDGDFS
jgi:hypothetical protein